MNKLIKKKRSSAQARSDLLATMQTRAQLEDALGFNDNANAQITFTGPQISRTMLIASSSLAAERPTADRRAISAPAVQRVAVPSPDSPGEQYWAARAMKAETLLTAQYVYGQEVKQLTLSGERKRAKEVAALARTHMMREAKLERLVIVLLIFILVLVVTAALMHPGQQGVSSKRGPWHFTIPILSPFASVVENETTAIGAKAFTLLAFFLVSLGYLCFRHWLGRAGQR